MGKPQKMTVITARILVESHTESTERTNEYVIAAIKSSLRRIRDGAVAIALYNDGDEMIGMDVSGVPSEALQEQIEELFESYEEKTA